MIDKMQRFYKDVTKSNKKLSSFFLEEVEKCKTTLEYKLLYNKIKRMQKDKTPFAYSRNKDRITVYNESFRPISYNYKKGVVGLTEIGKMAPQYSFRFEQAYTELEMILAEKLNVKKEDQRVVKEYLSF